MEEKMEAMYVLVRMPEQVGALRLEGEFFRDGIPLPWSGLNEAKLDQFPWDTGYMPACFARVGWNSRGVHVLMYANEPVIRCVETEIGGEVCEDSCLEFFLAPDAEAQRYVNCESNPVCVMHIGVGDGRYGRRVFHQIPEGFEPTHSEHRGGWWAVSYTIPADFFGRISVSDLRPECAFAAIFIPAAIGQTTCTTACSRLTHWKSRIITGLSSSPRCFSAIDAGHTEKYLFRGDTHVVQI
jgi:hypothetical protein